MKIKNSLIDFSNKIQNLINKKVIVRINYPSDLGYFSVEGILNSSDGKLFEVFYVENLKIKSYYGQIQFKIHMIKNIFNNLIDIKISYDENVVLYDVLKITELVKNYVQISFNQSDGVFSTVISGILKFNKKQNIYYVSDKNHNINCRFLFSAIDSISSSINLIKIRI